jgi:hypothetical protein
MKSLPTLTKILLVAGAVLLGGFIVAMDRPPAKAVKAPFVVTFEEPVNLKGLNPAKLAAALVRHKPVNGSRVTYDKILIFPPVPRESRSADISTGDITFAQQTKAGGGGFETDARHVAQSIGYEKAEDVVGFFEALK